MEVEQNAVVTFDYTLTDQRGQVIESTEGDEPLAYLHGHRNIIAGLEKALEGKAEGDRIHVSLPPAEAYGDRDEALVQTLPRSAFEGVDKLEVGMTFHAQAGEDDHVVQVTDVSEDGVTVDGNHPLAGEPLTFDVEIKEIRPATEEELQHGHVHGAHGEHG